MAGETNGDPAAQARRRQVLALLAERPGQRYALVAEVDAGDDVVIVAMGIKGLIAHDQIVTFELVIPKAKYDPFLLLNLVERHGSVVH